MTTFYRGIKVDGNIAKDNKLSKQGGIYRGIKPVSYTHLTLPTR